MPMCFHGFKKKNSREIEVKFLSKVDQKCEVDVISKPPDMHASSKVELFQWTSITHCETTWNHHGCDQEKDAKSQIGDW